MRALSLFDLDLPPLGYEKELSKKFPTIAGVDEAGRGALAGPVVAAAVVFDLNDAFPNFFMDQVHDSKTLSPLEREQAYSLIQKHAACIGIGIVQSQEIDQINILQATFQAMKKAVERLRFIPSLCLVDGKHKAPLTIPQKAIVQGDGRVFSIAAASIIAKVTRDRWMVDLDQKFPSYGFARHKGYGTTAHRKAIEKHGFCQHHRRSFSISAP